MTTNHKDLVQRALGSFLTGGPDALAPFLAEAFVHHRPDGTSRAKREWLADAQAALVHLAGMDVALQHLFADGDHVVLHSRRSLPSSAEVVVVDIFRIEDDRIAEAWEIIEPVVEAAAHLRWWERAQSFGVS